MSYQTLHSPANLNGNEKPSPVIINLFGGSGIGKSTLAANVFYHMKCQHRNCELVTEYAKDLVWREAFKDLNDEFYVFAKQHHRLKTVANHVDYIVTDSPILLPIIYDPEQDPLFRQFVLRTFNRYNNINFVLTRRKPYNPIGRLQTADEAKELDVVIRELLDTENIPYYVIDDPEHGWEDIKKVLEF